jgi:hypothetical protein
MWFWVGLYTAFCLAMAGLMFWLASPATLRLDTLQRTYQSDFWVFLRLQWRIGSWDDIRGVFVRRAVDSQNDCFTVGIACKPDTGVGGSFSTLGRFGDRERAYRLAEETAAILGCAVILPPTLNRLRSR